MGSSTDSWNISQWKTTWDVPITFIDNSKKKAAQLVNAIPKEAGQDISFSVQDNAAAFRDKKDASAWTGIAANISPKKKTAEEEKLHKIDEELSRQSLYKTELCRSFVDTGACRYGTKCQFAHGAHELRAITRHPKYKTEVCKNFATTGQCPYGNRCRFIHPGAIQIDNVWSNSWTAAEIEAASLDKSASSEEELSSEQLELENTMKRLAIFQRLAN